MEVGMMAVTMAQAIGTRSVLEEEYPLFQDG